MLSLYYDILHEKLVPLHQVVALYKNESEFSRITTIAPPPGGHPPGRRRLLPLGREAPALDGLGRHGHVQRLRRRLVAPPQALQVGAAAELGTFIIF